jgi:hypothetical protein
MTTQLSASPIGHLTVINSIQPRELGKVYSMKDGQLHKTVAAQMSEATYEVRQFDSIQALAEQLKSLRTNQALTASQPRTGTPTGRIVTEAKAAQEKCLARTKADFPLMQGPGVMTLDYDPQDPSTALSKAELFEKLKQLCPSVVGAGVVWWCSGSSYIFDGETQLQGLRGQRLYIMVEDASDIPRAGKNLADRCWLAGLGRVQISVSGAKLLRSLWDEAMFEAARLDFIGGAVCQLPVLQQRGEPDILSDGGWLDTRAAFSPLDEQEASALKRLHADAKEAATPRATAAKLLWVETKSASETIRLVEGGMPLEAAAARARRTYEAAAAGTLQGDFQIPLANAKFISVAEVLDNPAKWDGVKTFDPLEPEHRNFELCGKLYLTGARQNLFSFAHGGITFALTRQARRVEWRAGEQSLVADELAKALVCQGDIFYSGGARADLVQARAGSFEMLGKQEVQYLLGHRVALHKRTKDGEISMNPTAELSGMTMAALGHGPEQTPRSLVALTSLPYATAEGRLVLQPGFDSDSGIYNTMQCPAPELPDKVSHSDVVAALKVIWAPWREFQFASPIARGAMLAAIFTTVLRPAMAIAPGVFFDAPVQNSGKTKAGLALGSLMTGDSVGVCPFVAGIAQETEYSKSAVALLRSSRRFWMIDNVTGYFDSPVLAVMFTSGNLAGRILGQSKDGAYSGRVMMVATGNNAQLGPDLSRRYLPARIDTGSARPGDLPHSFDPAEVAKATRMDIAKAVLTVLKASWQGPPVTLSGGSDFPEWNKLVRLPLAWVEQSGLAVEAGLGLTEDASKAFAGDELSPDDLALNQLVHGAMLTFGLNEQFFSKDVYRAVHREFGETPVRDEGPSMMLEGFMALMKVRDLTAISVGRVLANRRDRPIEGGFKLQRGKTHAQLGVIWQVTSCS